MAAVAELIVEQDLPARAAELGAWLSATLSSLPGVRSVSGRGLLLGVNLDRPAKPVVTALRERGVLVGGSSQPRQLRLLPPLTLTREEAGVFVQQLGQVLSGHVDAPIGTVPSTDARVQSEDRAPGSATDAQGEAAS